MIMKEENKTQNDFKLITLKKEDENNGITNIR